MWFSGCVACRLANSWRASFCVVEFQKSSLAAASLDQWRSAVLPSTCGFLSVCVRFQNNNVCDRFAACSRAERARHVQLLVDWLHCIAGLYALGFDASAYGLFLQRWSESSNRDARCSEFGCGGHQSFVVGINACSNCWQLVVVCGFSLYCVGVEGSVVKQFGSSSLCCITF